MTTLIFEHECWGRLKRYGGIDNTGTLPEEVLLKNEETVIGREKKANIDYAFGAAYISSRHLKVKKSSVTSAEDDVPADEYHVIDTSRNGTFVLHTGAEYPVRCEPNVPHHISEGDQILFMFKAELRAVYVVRIHMPRFSKTPPPLDTHSLFSVFVFNAVRARRPVHGCGGNGGGGCECGGGSAAIRGLSRRRPSRKKGPPRRRNGH
jgi:FHA domain